MSFRILFLITETRILFRLKIIFNDYYQEFCYLINNWSINYLIACLMFINIYQFILNFQ